MPGKVAANRDRRLYVGNLPPDICEEDVDDLFYEFGKIEFIDLQKSRGPSYAFVEFEESRDAEDAVRSRDGYDYDGYRVRCEFTRGVGPRGSGGCPVDPEYANSGFFKPGWAGSYESASPQSDHNTIDREYKYVRRSPRPSQTLYKLKLNDLMNEGYHVSHCNKALNMFDGNVERARIWLKDHEKDTLLFSLQRAGKPWSGSKSRWPTSISPAQSSSDGHDYCTPPPEHRVRPSANRMYHNKMDSDFLRQVPARHRQISFFDLNDNIDKEFLEKLCQRIGAVTRVRVLYEYDSSTRKRKHMGIGYVQFHNVQDAKQCVAMYHREPIMGKRVSAVRDIDGQIYKKGKRTRLRLLEEAQISSAPPPPPPKSTIHKRRPESTNSSSPPHDPRLSQSQVRMSGFRSDEAQEPLWRQCQSTQTAMQQGPYHLPSVASSRVKSSMQSDLSHSTKDSFTPDKTYESAHKYEQKVSGDKDRARDNNGICDYYGNEKPTSDQKPPPPPPSHFSSAAVAGSKVDLFRPEPTAEERKVEVERLAADAIKSVIRKYTRNFIAVHLLAKFTEKYNKNDSWKYGQTMRHNDRMKEVMFRIDRELYDPSTSSEVHIDARRYIGKELFKCDNRKVVNDMLDRMYRRNEIEPPPHVKVTHPAMRQPFAADLKQEVVFKPDVPPPPLDTLKKLEPSLFMQNLRKSKPIKTETTAAVAIKTECAVVSAISTEHSQGSSKPSGSQSASIIVHRLPPTPPVTKKPTAKRQSDQPTASAPEPEPKKQKPCPSSKAEPAQAKGQGPEGFLQGLLEMRFDRQLCERVLMENRPFRTLEMAVNAVIREQEKLEKCLKNGKSAVGSGAQTAATDSERVVVPAPVFGHFGKRNLLPAISAQDNLLPDIS